MRITAEALNPLNPEVREAIQALRDESEDAHAAAAEALTTVAGQDFGEDATAWQQWWDAQP